MNITTILPDNNSERTASVCQVMSKIYGQDAELTTVQCFVAVNPDGDTSPVKVVQAIAATVKASDWHYETFTRKVKQLLVINDRYHLQVWFGNYAVNLEV